MESLITVQVDRLFADHLYYHTSGPARAGSIRTVVVTPSRTRIPLSTMAFVGSHLRTSCVFLR